MLATARRRGRRWFLASVVWLLAAVSLLSACDPFPEFDKIGVTRGSDGRIEILYYACRGERVSRFELRLVRGDYGEGDDIIAWEARGAVDHAGLLVAIVGGTLPAGFQVTIPFTRPLPVSEEVLAAVDSSEGGAALSVLPSALQEGRILTNGRRYAISEDYVADARAACPSG